MGLVFFLQQGAAFAAAAAVAVKYNIPDIKVFQLQERQVVAVAVENRIPGQGIDDVLGYHIDPVFTEKRAVNRFEVVLSNVAMISRDMPANSLVAAENIGPDQVRFSVSGEDAARAAVSTVQRKTVKGRDGMIRMRTYLVFTIPKGSKKEIPTVVLDAGHGGEDTGAVKNFINEKDINLDITLRTAHMFEEKGWNVVLTRREDIEPSLLDRADAANIVGADVFISIHNNALPEEKEPYSREYGTTVLYNSSAVKPAYELARIAQDEIIGALGTQREVMQDRPRLVVLNSTWVPAILTEGIMMPNPANAKMVLDRLQRQRMAEAIVKATETWRGRKVLAADKTTPAQSLIQLEPQLSAGAGNSPANTANHGTVAAKDGWIFYLRKADSLHGEKEETLWRFRPDQFLSDQLVADAEAWDVSLFGEWVYYANWSDGQAIYRARPDGSGAVRLVNGPAQQVNIAGEQIVFVKDRRICSVKREGGMELRLADDEAENVAVEGNWVYYANGTDGFKPYRIKLDGTGRMKIVNDETLFMIAAGGWIFYSNLSDGEKLYRVKTDGTGRARVSDDRAGYLSADSKFIYYTGTSQGNAVFRIRADGGERARLMDGGPGSGPIGIAGGKLYYRGVFIDLKP